MIGEDIASVTNPAQYEGFSEEQEDISQSRGSTQLRTTTHSKKTKIVLAVVSAVLVIYLSASFYVAATQLAAEGLAVVGAVNILVAVCTAICMCIYVERRKGMGPMHTTQDPNLILSTEEVSLGGTEHDGPTVAENVPHQDLHDGNTRPFPAASASDTAPTLALQLGPFALTGDTGKRTPIIRPVIITTKAEIAPPPSPQSGSTILDANKQTPTTQPVTITSADSPSSTTPSLVPRSGPLASTKKQTPATKPVTTTNALDTVSPLVPKRSESTRSAGLDSLLKPLLAPQRSKPIRNASLDPLPKPPLPPKHLGGSQQKSAISTTPVEGASRQVTATKSASTAGASSPSSTKSSLVPRSGPLASTKKQTPATKPVTTTNALDTAPPLAPQRSKSARSAGLDSSPKPPLAPQRSKPIMNAGLGSSPKPPLAPKHMGVGSLSKHLGDSQQKSAISTTPVEGVSRQVTATKSASTAGASSPSSTKSSLVPRSSPLTSTSKQTPATQPVTIISADSPSSTKPPLAPRRFGSPKYMGVGSLPKHLGDSQQKSAIPTVPSKPKIDDLLGIDDPFANALQQPSPQFGSTILDANKQTPATQPVTMISADLPSSTKPPLVLRSSPLTSTSKQTPATQPVTMISADLPSSTKPPLAPRRFGSPKYMGVGSSAQLHLPPLPEGVQLLSSSAQQHGASQTHNEPKIDDLLGIDELFAAALQQTSDMKSSAKEPEHESALVDQSQSLPTTTGYTVQPGISASKPHISNTHAHQPALSFRAVASAVKHGTTGNLKTKLQSGVRKVQHGLLKKVAHATGTPAKRAFTGVSCYGRSSVIEQPYFPTHADVTTLDADPDTGVITHYKSNQPHTAERNSTLVYDLCPANWEACSTVTGVDEGKKEVDAQYQKARVAEASYGLETPSAAKPTTTLKRIKKKAASLSKAVTRAAHVAYIDAELAFGIYDAVPSKAYGFQLAPEIAPGGPQDVYLLIRGKNTHLCALAAISDVKTRTLWLCTGDLHTKRGHIPISNLEFRIMSAGDERSFEYKSQYQIALKLIMPAFGAVPRLLTSAQHEFSISHSGKSRDLFLTTRVSTNSRTNIIKLVATSATFKSYRKAFFYIYTESVIHAMVKHMNVIMRREFAHLDQQSLTVCAALDMYANQNYMSMMRAITDFFLRDPLGIAVYSDTALCIKYIGELIRFYTSSGDYPAYHALFWKLVVQEVWGCGRCGPTGTPRYDWHASEYDREFVIDLHVICALICKKQAMTDREEVYSFIEKIMQIYESTSDSPGTRLAHYLALATVASPRLHKGIKALDIQHERWKKLLRTAEHTLKLYQLDAEASAIKALSKTSGAKHPCRINTLLLSDFTETTAYKIALQNDQKLQQLRNILGPDYAPHQLALASDSVVHIVDKHTHTKGGEAIPYAVFVSHLQDVYLRVEGKYYLQNIIPKLLHHWADIRTRNPNMVNRPACEDAQAVIRLLEAKVSTTRLHTRDDAPSSSLPGTRLTSCTTSYPFSGRTLERIGDAALTGFLSVVSVSPAMRELSLLQPECSIHLDVARAIT